MYVGLKIKVTPADLCQLLKIFHLGTEEYFSHNKIYKQIFFQLKKKLKLNAFFKVNNINIYQI